MDNSKFHFRILYTCWAICIFICLDAYFAPLKSSTQQQIIDYETFTTRSKAGSARNTYTIYTNERSYDVPKDLYNDVIKGDTILIMHSEFTNSLQKIALVKGDNLYTYDAGFIRTYGVGLCIFLALFILMIRVFYKTNGTLQWRANVTYLLLIATLVILWFHLDIHFT